MTHNQKSDDAGIRIGAAVPRVREPYGTVVYELSVIHTCGHAGRYDFTWVEATHKSLRGLWESVCFDCDFAREIAKWRGGDLFETQRASS